jgi:hypothetical protein
VYRVDDVVSGRITPTATFPLPELAVVVAEPAVVVPEALLFLLDDPQAVITRDAVVASASKPVTVLRMFPYFRVVKRAPR